MRLRTSNELCIFISGLEQALAAVDEVLNLPYSLIIRDAAIQRFKYTFELTWKTFRKIAKIEGIETGSPRQAIRAVYDVRLIDDIDLWFQMMDDRNRTSHTYNAITAEAVYDSAKHLPEVLRKTIQSIREKYLGL